MNYLTDVIAADAAVDAATAAAVNVVVTDVVTVNATSIEFIPDAQYDGV